MGTGWLALRGSRKHEHGASARHLVPRPGGLALSPRHGRVRALLGGRRQSLDACPSTARAGRFRETTAATAAGFTGSRADGTRRTGRSTGRSPGRTLMASSRHMDHKGYPARFAMTSVVYEDGKLPGYEGQLISGMALTSRIQATRLVADGSTFRTVDTEAAGHDSRPQLPSGRYRGRARRRALCGRLVRHPDGSHRSARHVGQVVRTDLASAGRRTTGRSAPFNLAQRSSQDLDRAARRQEKVVPRARTASARRAQRPVARSAVAAAVPASGRGQLALEALWTANLISGMDSELGARSAGSPRCARPVLDIAPVESVRVDHAAAAGRGWSDWLAPSRMPR